MIEEDSCVGGEKCQISWIRVEIYTGKRMKWLPLSQSKKATR